MKEQLTIPKTISSTYGKDFQWLRKQGITYIEALSGKLWTDYNTHDPGITFLELLCYAITDLGYRIATPIPDMLAAPENQTQDMHQQFLSALNVLPCAPVTADDFRKILVRIEGVKNAWLVKNHTSMISRFKQQPPQMRYAQPNSEVAIPNEELKFTLQGLCDILVEFEELEADSEAALEAAKKEILDNVRKVYHHFRNLSEDVVSVKEIPEQEVVFCADIELEAKADPEAVWAAICFAISQYLAPEISFYSLGELQDKGKSSDEIFNGPVFDFSKISINNEVTDKPIFAQTGFIDDEEIAHSVLPDQIRLSDVIGIVSKVIGVKSIRSISFAFCSCEEPIENPSLFFDSDVWLLCIKEGHKPVLCLDNTVLNFYKDVIPIQLKEEEAREKLAELHAQNKRRLALPTVTDLPMPTGNYRDLGTYTTMQNHLPETYGVGRVGLSESDAPARHAQAKQLKAYLLFFDQVIANYFAQLSQVKLLLSADNSVAATYFSTAVQQLKGIEEILPDQDAAQQIFNHAQLDQYPERKNLFLDHLLARFNEQFNEYVFLLHRLYGSDFDHAAIRHKVNFLKDYQQVSAWRGSAFDYCNPLPIEQEEQNVSGMEKRLSRMLGFQNYKRQPLAALPYQVAKVNVAPHAFYTWNIIKDALVFLFGNGNGIKELDAYEDLALASVLACEERHYRWLVAPESGKVSSVIVNGKEEIIALINSQQDLAFPMEMFTAASTCVQQIVDSISVVYHLSTDSKKVSFSIINSEGTTIGRSAAQYALLPGELATGVYSLAQNDVDLVLAAASGDFSFLLNTFTDSFQVVLQSSEQRIVFYTTESFTLSGELPEIPGESLLIRTEAIDYFSNEFRLEGMYVVEHILLRPDEETAPPDAFLPVCIDPNGAYCRPLDPYSFRISVILPGYSLRLRNKYFRKYAEQLIRLETPAHILPRICFVDEDHMALFETTYLQWLQAKQEAAFSQQPMDQQINKDLINVLEDLFTLYDQGYLTDCDDDTDNLNPIVLGSTFLGSLASNSDDPIPE